MNNLLTLQANDFDPSAPAAIDSEYNLREAARAVLFSPSGEVYLMNVTKSGYHKLPGGGIDEGENKQEALARELLEEVGCIAMVEAEVGMITEYRPLFNSQKQLSYCYIARQVGDQQASALEEGEIAEGMVEVKAPSIDAAIQLLEEDKPQNLEGKYIQRRDLTFLKQARNLL